MFFSHDEEEKRWIKSHIKEIRLLNNQQVNDNEYISEENKVHIIEKYRKIADYVENFLKNSDRLNPLSIQYRVEFINFIENFKNISEIIDKSNDEIIKGIYDNEIKWIKSNIDKINYFNSCKWNNNKYISLNYKERIENEYNSLFQKLEKVIDNFNKLKYDNYEYKLEINDFVDNFKNIDKTVAEFNKKWIKPKLEEVTRFNNYEILNNEKYISTSNKREIIDTYNSINNEIRQYLEEYGEDSSIIPKEEMETFAYNLKNIDETIKKSNEKFIEKEYRPHEKWIIENLEKINSLNDHENWDNKKYLTKSQFTERYRPIAKKIKDILDKFSEVPVLLDEHKKTLNSFIRNYENSNKIIEKSNEKFINKEYKPHEKWISANLEKINSLNSYKIRNNETFIKKEDIPKIKEEYRKIAIETDDFINKMEKANYKSFQHYRTLKEFLENFNNFNYCIHKSNENWIRNNVNIIESLDTYEIWDNRQYIAKSDIPRFKYEYQTIANNLSEFLDESNGKSSLKSKIERFINKFNAIQNNINILNSIIDKSNEKFIAKEYQNNKGFFSYIEGKQLYEKQIEAVLNDEDHLQIIAGAGTGKTFTLLSKVKYLTEIKGVSPEDILAISFSNASVKDIQKKMDKHNLNIDISTFHKLGKSILKEKGVHLILDEDESENTTFWNNNSTNIPFILDEDGLDDVIDDYFYKEVIKDPDKIKDVIELLSYYFNIPTSIINEEESNEDERYETFKSKILYNEYKEGTFKTLQFETVKSKYELWIANYLFLHNINYTYEKNYERPVNEEHIKNLENIPDTYYKVTDRIILDYNPDFYFDDYDIYLEHFGVDKNGWATWMDTKEEMIKYREGIIWKRRIHEACETEMIELYSYYHHDKNYFEKFREKLTDAGIKINDVNYKKVYKRVIDCKKIDEFENLKDLIIRFIRLFKGNDYDEYYFDEIEKENFNEENNFIRTRNKLLLRIIKNVYRRYENHLKENNKIDFDDMINKAASKVAETGFNKHYRYILVDEYQDTSFTRYKLLKEIKDSINAKLVVVGDDWQSIYRFTGCDIKLFTNFEEYFSDPAEIIINKTHRNSQSLLNASRRFITENANQLEKRGLKSVSNNQIEKPIKVCQCDSNYVQILVLEDIIQKIAEKDDNETILILGRNNNDINRFIKTPLFKKQQDKYKKKNKDKIFTIKYSKNPSLKIKYMTVHKSKGLEADNVILINLKDSIIGFPNKIQDDSILKYVSILDDEPIDYPEERRLFYVALTRTRSNVYLLAPKVSQSQFVQEIKEYKDEVDVIDYTFDYDNLDDNIKIPIIIETKLKCPKCGIGNLTIVKLSGEKPFFSCTNYPKCRGVNGKYEDNLNKTDEIKLCPRCGGVLIKRNGINGPFLGCSNYSSKTRKCTYTEEILTNYTQYTTEIACPNCGSEVRLFNNPQYDKTILKCLNENCDWKERAYNYDKGDNLIIKNCPECDGILLKKNGRYGLFLGCSNYPKCSHTENIPYYKLNRF